MHTRAKTHDNAGEREASNHKSLSATTLSLTHTHKPPPQRGWVPPPRARSAQLDGLHLLGRLLGVLDASEHFGHTHEQHLFLLAPEKGL